jgi:hypothetical protein
LAAYKTLLMRNEWLFVLHWSLAADRVILSAT